MCKQFNTNVETTIVLTNDFELCRWVKVLLISHCTTCTIKLDRNDNANNANKYILDKHPKEKKFSDNVAIILLN